MKEYCLAQKVADSSLDCVHFLSLSIPLKKDILGFIISFDLNIILCYLFYSISLYLSILFLILYIYIYVCVATWLDFFLI